MNIVLLPGLDGTGHLFTFLRQQIPKSISVEQHSLLQSGDVTYVEQAEHILSQLDAEKEYLVVAESYSGRIAFELGLIAQKHRIRHIIFAASFLGKPSKLARFASLLPLTPVKKQWIPKNLIGVMLFGFGQSDVTKTFFKALHEVDNKVLRFRLNQVSKLKRPDQRTSIPCTYIQAQYDNLVSAKSAQDFERCCTELSTHQVPGKHFILQTHAEDCWKIIDEVINQLGSKS